MGLAALFFGSAMLYKSFDLKLNGIIVKGTIVDAQKNHGVSRSYINGNNGTKNDGFYPLLEYNVNGKTITSTAHTSISGLDLAIGDETEVIFRSSEPTYVEVKDALTESFISGTVCTLMGILFTFILGLFGYRVIKLKREEQNNLV
jgi:hypothetical protein